MYLKGSGYESIIFENPQRYADELISILENAKPGSEDEELALAFFEYAIDQPRVRKNLNKIWRGSPKHRYSMFCADNAIRLANYGICN